MATLKLKSLNLTMNKKVKYKFESKLAQNFGVLEVLYNIYDICSHDLIISLGM